MYRFQFYLYVSCITMEYQNILQFVVMVALLELLFKDKFPSILTTYKTGVRAAITKNNHS